ncbi:hypothetical protein UFOVP181_321 [uncultured Caudovirales phage]|uniref:Uncharacterized protein n=1 Tax=uncultured Caudovirales phage TaxID=2100421 RepID=A0A6J7WLA8_9CAUD|nr:hypothetical protein UFOVP57_318 [uncultured Caudovirales phage]CAB5209114.1 hypothetical protein UFOVP181_321 [uncultured Caudovirales phage]
MSNGALIFAHNNPIIDYTKLAIFAARRVIQFLGVPVSLVTDNKQWLLNNYPDHPFDQVIEIELEDSTRKLFYDGSLSSMKFEWKNVSRNRAYELSPYDKTLVLDSDYIISSDVLKLAFDRNTDLQIYSKSFDLAGWRDTAYFERINPYSIPFYWATAFVFQKNQIMESFFDLVSYIKGNWSYFRVLYNIEAALFRNDIAFSIAIHIMNGKTAGGFSTELPGTMTYIQDRDILINIKDADMQLLVEKQNYLGEYQAVKTQGIDVHVMNKQSLTRFIDGGSGV